MIQDNFGYYFYISDNPREFGGAVNKLFVSRKGIYKDCYGGSNEEDNYLLRPNGRK